MERLAAAAILVMSERLSEEGGCVQVVTSHVSNGLQTIFRISGRFATKGPRIVINKYSTGTILMQGDGGLVARAKALQPTGGVMRLVPELNAGVSVDLSLADISSAQMATCDRPEGSKKAKGKKGVKKLRKKKTMKTKKSQD